MVSPTHILHTSNNSFHLTQHLTCKHYGIYVATCCICKEQYVGQTKNRFSIRWNNHRSAWNSQKTFNVNEDGTAALFQHYQQQHQVNLTKGLKICQCFTVIFVEQPDYDRLDRAEDKWVNKIGATINIKRIILPKIK